MTNVNVAVAVDIGSTSEYQQVPPRWHGLPGSILAHGRLSQHLGREAPPACLRGQENKESKGSAGASFACTLILQSQTSRPWFYCPFY